MPRPGTAAPLAAIALLALAPAARADTVNFDLSGKIYMKYMYQNDNTQGCLSMSNPFWLDNIQGHNGACTEFELNIKANVGPKVTAGIRLQSRWGQIWQDWWENGDLKPGVQDTSGESLGMNHAAYIKLRSAWIRAAPPIPTVRWITVGSTDFSMWSEWTIGKARYIDRDNGQGVFIEGDFLPKKQLSYTMGAMAMPKLWAGPGWQTGLSYNDPLAGLWGTDWAFALKLESRIGDDLRLRLIGALLNDWEADRYSPMLTGPPSAERGADHSVAWDTRFRGANGTLDATWTPAWLEMLTVSGLFGASSNYVNPLYATNQVRNGQGFSPVVFRVDGAGNAVASTGLAGKLSVELADPFKIGLSVKLEYFNIGSEYNAVMGSRREADVLLTDGLITGGFTRGGQLPTLNIANEFQDWDESWYEACIGWKGLTAVFEYATGPLKATLEGTAIGYNTNMQNRDVANQFPDFLYTHGFTDTTAFTADADYANRYDRGKDPRSVYTQFQDRRTWLAVLNLQYNVPGALGAVFTVKGKYIDDRDNRITDPPYLASLPALPANTPTKVCGKEMVFSTGVPVRTVDSDDYCGQAYLGMITIGLQPTNELKTLVGYEYSHRQEDGREGSQASGYSPATTLRNTVHVGFSYAYGGALFTYMLEYFHKDLKREPYYYDMKWNVWRSKASLEVSF
jgi:hypothetical protein